MSKSTLIRLGAGALIAFALGGCYYPYGPGYYGGPGWYGPPGPHYGYWR
jgi:hypothetical protein